MKAERKYLVHYIDDSFGGTTNYVRIGKDLEEYTIDLNPDVEVTKNILGEQSVKHNGYEVSSEVDPYYVEYDEPLGEKLTEIANRRLTGDDCRTTMVNALIKPGSSPTVEWAYREDVYVVPTSIGGDTSGAQIPFKIYHAGNIVSGTWNISTSTFTTS